MCQCCLAEQSSPHTKDQQQNRAGLALTPSRTGTSFERAVRSCSQDVLLSGAISVHTTQMTCIRPLLASACKRFPPCSQVSLDKDSLKRNQKGSSEGTAHRRAQCGHNVP